jgi:hypothetical protein
MKKQNDENLEELLGKFLGTEEARKAAGEIRQGEELFARHPAPELDERQIASIKAQISARLSKPGKTISTARVFKIAGLAAAIIILGWVVVLFFELSRPEPRIERTVAVEGTYGTWSDWDEADADDEITGLTEEIDQIENSIFALRLGEQDGANGAVLADIETEMVEIDNFFWKG